jgi:hypothetical protein
MKLIGQTLGLQELMDFVDPFGHDEARSRGSLGEKVPHGSADRPGHADKLPLAREQCKLAVDMTDLLCAARRDPCASFVERHIEQHVGAWVEQVDDSFNVGMVRHVSCFFCG